MSEEYTSKNLPPGVSCLLMLGNLSVSNSKRASLSSLEANGTLNRVYLPSQ